MNICSEKVSPFVREFYRSVLETLSLRHVLLLAYLALGPGSLQVPGLDFLGVFLGASGSLYCHVWESPFV
jgi:hypothetical protein